MFRYVPFVLLLFTHAYGEVYFKEEFADDNWEHKWISSEHPSKDWGKFILSPGKYYADPEISKGIQTSEDEKFYGIATKFEPFSNEGRVLVIQFTVRHTQIIKCGGGYIKLFDCSLKPKRMHSYTPYLIMFGPDICGADKKVQVIFNYRERKLKMKRKVNCKDGHLTHLYTLIIKPDNTYVIKIDNKIEKKGQLEEDWDFLPPRKIKKPTATEPEDKGLDNFNEIPNQSQSLIDNPDYVVEPDLYKYEEICGVGFDLWQVKSGTIFDNILITDDELEAEKHAEVTWGVIQEKEKKMKVKFKKAADAEETSTKHEHDEF